MPSSEIAELLARPDLPQIMADLNAHLQVEAERRARFRAEITPEMKGEFINGAVIMHSPAKVRHLQVTIWLATLLQVHAQRHRLGRVFVEKAMIEATRNDYEPDVVFFGQTRADALASDELLLPMPDFIVEVLSPPTEARDRGIKFRDYAAHGVCEYWIVDAEAETVETFGPIPGARDYQATGRFSNHPGGVETRLSSAVVLGFSMPVRALFDDDTNAAPVIALLAAPAPPAA